MKASLAVIIGVLVVTCAVLWWKLDKANNRAGILNERVDSLRSVELNLLLEESGWETVSVNVAKNLTMRLQQERDSTDAVRMRNADLARDVELLGGYLREMTEMYAEAVGQIESHGTTHMTGQETDSVTATVDDGLLSGRLFYRTTGNVLGIDPYNVRVSLTTGIVELPNGQWSAIADADDDRVVINIDQVRRDPPEPLQICSLGQKAPWYGYGVLTGGIAALLFSGN